MSEQTTLGAFATLLSGASFTTGNPPLLNPTTPVYTDVPDLSSPLPAPFCIVAPGTQRDTRNATGGFQQHGVYTILYFDRVDPEGSYTIADLMAQMRAFAATLRQQIRHDPTLGVPGLQAGEGEIGIVVHYAEAGQIEAFAGRTYYHLPVDIEVWDVEEPYT